MDIVKERIGGATPFLNKAGQDAVGLLQGSAEAATGSAVHVMDSLTRRGPGGEPIGALATLKDWLIHRVTLRLKKMTNSYRRRMLQPA